MRVPQYAMRSLAALALAGLAVGCGGDNTAPDAPFDPAGTTADVGTIEQAFESDAMASYLSAAPAISAALGETPAAVAVRATPSRSLVRGDRSGLRQYAGALAKSSRAIGWTRPTSSSAAILDEHLGVTFTRDPETLEYEPSDRAGAPANGVRFIVYAVNPISGQPTTPLQEVGYADVEVTETSTSLAFRVELVSDDVTYLDYAVGATGTASSMTLTVQGFVTNGDDRVNFDLDTRLTEARITLDYTLSVPTRGNVRLDFEEEITSNTMTSNVELRGPHGTVTIQGSRTASAGSYDVEVNGEAFATITVTQGEDPVITGADGEPLSQEELTALHAVFLIFLGGFDFFEDLLDPLT